MDWLNDVESKLKRKNQVLFDKDSEFLADLSALIQEQNHRVMVLWAFEFAEETVQKLLQRYPNEKRLEAALTTSKDWAAGRVKMPVAKHAILQAHAVAKEIDSIEDIALCHAIGQACGVVHANGHAIGFPIYDLTAIVRKYGVPECKRFVEERKQQYIERIYYWREHYQDYPHKWADFMMKD
ncbi:MAG: putative immunity protein [Solirubrobacterales bacterium]